MITEYINYGISVIPVKPDKKPIGNWRPYQTRLATTEEYGKWSLPIAAVGGKVSGGLVCIDFDDGGSAFKEWCDLVRMSNASVLNDVYCQRTPSGGYHIVFRTKKEIRNNKLAQRMVDGKVVGLIETRGEGGYFLLAPSKGYAQYGPFCIADLKVIDDCDVDILINSGKALNEIVKEPTSSKPAFSSEGVSPFDDYDAKEDVVSFLDTFGWNVVFKRGTTSYLCRPGKKGAISATWNHVPNRFYVFSSSTVFETEHVYKPSAVYAILNHNGDYVSAARELYARGYGDRHEKEKVVAPLPLKADSFRQRFLDMYKNPRDSGFSVGLPKFDELLRLDRGYMNIVTGVPSSGKSEFVDFLTVLLAKRHGWRFTVFSPENYPLEIHCNKLAEKYHGTGMWGKDANYHNEALDFINDHYSFVDATIDDITLDMVLETALNDKPDCLLIDPWNEIDINRPYGVNESEFAGKCLTKIRKFGRKNNICVIIVVHPTKMYRVKGKDEYPKPTMYDISGSAHFYNKADNGVAVYRDFKGSVVDINVLKVKFKTHGKIGEVKMRYRVESGEYEEVDEDSAEVWFDGM